MSQFALNPQQRNAVEHGNGPLLIIAGAGTGKTTVITERIKYLILEKKTPPTQILALTFTEKAAAEMETRIDEAMPYGYTQLWIQTFHAFCDRVLRQDAIHIGLNPAFTMMTEAESLLFLRKHIFDFELDYFRPLGNPMKFLQGMLQHFNRLSDDDISPEQYMKYAQEISNFKFQISNKKTYQNSNGKKKDLHPSPFTLHPNEDIDENEIKKTMELAKAFVKYEELKAKEGYMDFSNLISNTLKLFRTRKNILKDYQKKFQYILVDEFQDTNYAQNELAILLAGDDKNITVVGDDDQSIYRWRGAAIANMMQFHSHFPKAAVITLTKNYRSTQTILDSAYRVIQNNNPYRLEVQEKINKKLNGLRGIKGEDIEILYATKGEDEAEEVVKTVKTEVKRNNRAYNDFAILVRANDHALPFQRSLERAKIPYQFLGPGRLFQQEEIKDLIAYLRVLANYEDSSSLYRVLTLPIFGIEARDIASVLNYAKRKNCLLFETLEQIDKTGASSASREKFQWILVMIRKHLKKVPRENAGQILYYFFEESGLLGHYLDPRTQKTEREAQNIAKFFDKLQTYTTQHEDASVFAVVDFIDLSKELGESPLAADIDWTENNAVNILTIHSSKGLEFPVVFVVNLVTQRFPSRDRKEQIPVPKELIREQLPEEQDENLQEERRLFYVAMTRAKDKLFLTSAKYYGDGRKERKLSPFLYEALGSPYIESIIKKHKEEITGQQLSLLEVLNVNADKKEEKDLMDSVTIKSKTITIDTISYSQLATFDLCPLHYKLRYLLKLPSPASPALSFGTSIHTALRGLYLHGYGRSALKDGVLDQIIESSWMSEGYENKVHEEKAKENAKALLLSYMEHNPVDGKVPLATELPFSFYLKNVKVLGRLDRVDLLPDKRIEIIDYKTGTMPDEKKLKDDLQLTMYALAATEIKDPLLNRTPDEILLTLYYVEQNKKFTTTRTKEQLTEAKEILLKRVDEIMRSDFACSNSMFCASCEYQMLCSTYNR